jgi:lipoprotein-releasing system permease protein
MNVPFFIARRYMLPRRLSIISVIGSISVVGITIGTAALIIILSLFNGFRGVARDLMIGFGPHLQVVSSEGARIADASAVVPIVERITETTTTQSITTKVVLLAGSRTGVAQAVGVGDEMHSTMDGPRRSTFIGDFLLDNVDGLTSIVISSGIAENLRLYVGDTVQILAPETIERSLRTMSTPRGVDARVRGIFQSNAARDVDHQRIYLTYAASSAVTRDDRPTSIDAMIASPRQAASIGRDVQQALLGNVHGKGLAVRTWEDLNRGLVDTMELERLGSFLVLALIILVASFNVLVSLTLGVVEKRRDIAVLLTMGLTPAEIRRVYLIQGLTIGTISVIAGVLIGVFVCWGQITFSWIRFDMAEGYLVPALPVEMQIVDILTVALVGLLLAATAAIYPASRASRTVIAEAVRVE